MYPVRVQLGRHRSTSRKRSAAKSKRKSKMLSATLNGPSRAHVPLLTAESSLRLHCDRCRMDRLAVIAGQTFQIAWCLHCRGTLTLIMRSPARGNVRIISAAVRHWIDVESHLLVLTTRGLITIRLDRMRLRGRCSLITAE
jgi:hypothetical protein